MFKNETLKKRIKKDNSCTTLSDTLNGIPRPRITSTPLQPTPRRRETLFATPPKTHLISPKKYVLSDIATPPRRGTRDAGRPHISVGPLLASTKYNTNVSTYMDTKSPGLASRIVQYNEEQQQQQKKSNPTHYKKYDSPGLFPIVHLFKQKPPLLEQKAKSVSVRIASPEYSRHNSPEYSRQLMEGILRPSPNRSSFASTKGHVSTSTRSVLDALKEISRKRIHTTEEYDVHEDTGKRQRTDCFNGLDKHKRHRDEKDKADGTVSPTSSQKSKRVCVYDEYAASCSSSMYPTNKLKLPPKRKSANISTITENPKETKQVKLINAETQTIESKTNEDLKTEDCGTNTDDEINKDPPKRNMPLKIFDDTPLKRIRENRLATLMGTLSGKSPILLPKPTAEDQFSKDSSLDEIEQVADTNLVGILSPPKASASTDKHVTFDLASDTLSSVPLDVSQPSISVSKPSTIITQAPESVKFTSEPSKLAFGNEKVNTTLNQNSVASTPPTSPVPQFSVPSSSSSVGLENIVSTLTPKLSDDSIKSTPSFSFSKSPATVSLPDFLSQSPLNLAATSVTSAVSTTKTTASTFSAFDSAVNKSSGGFKFDLNSPKTLTSSTVNVTLSTSVPQFSFGAPSNKSTTVINTASTSLSTSGQQNLQSVKPGSFNFETAKDTSIPIFSTCATTTTISPSFGSAALAKVPSTPASFSFGTNELTVQSKSSVIELPSTNKPTFSFNSNTTITSTSSSTTSIPTFSVPTSTVSFGTGTTSAPPVFSSTTTASAVFGLSTIATTFANTTPSFSFGSIKTSSTNNVSSPPTFNSKPQMTFGIGTTTSSFTSGNSFGITTTANNTFTSNSVAFGPSNTSITPKTTAPAFGTPTTSVFTAGSTFANNKSFSFVASPATSVASTSSFGTVVTPSFSTAVTSASMFGKGSTTFGNTINSQFSGANNQASSPFNNGSSNVINSNTNSPFGAKSPFATANSPASFGITKTTTSASTMFTSTTSSGFGQTNNIFGTSSQNKPLFGGTSGFENATPATTAPTFNSSSTLPAFGATNTFGAKTSGQTFVTPGFANTTTANSNFGTTSTFANSSTNFGSTNNPVFGSTPATSTFVSNNTFGNNSPGRFGNNTPTFSAPTTNASSNFGSNKSITNTGNNMFSGSNNASSSTSAFGQEPNNIFGTPNTNNTFGTGFGSSPGTSAFAKPQSSTGGFGASSTNTNTFGANTSTNFGAGNTFGNSTVPTTQSSGVFNFGSNTAPKPSGVFSFGGGGGGGSNEIPKPNFSFSGGATANPPAFGASAANTASFGTTSVPPFAPATAGTFSIGTWSTGSNSQRTSKSKPKRR